MQEQYRQFTDDDYYEYYMVVTLPNGRPAENRIMEKEFMKLKKKAGLPEVVFHSLRHSSTHTS